MQHTHFASATHTAATFLSILAAGTLWRILCFQGLVSRRPLIRGLSRAGLVQY